ncbi:MAG: 6-phosphogluconolactonase [Tepidisphaeraceae bacterium]
MVDPEIKVLPTPAEVAHEAADRFVRSAAAAIEFHHFFTVGLSGGSTPKAMFQLLASAPYRKQVEWTKVEVFFVDERCVPPEHPESNFRMAHQTLLSKVPIPGDNIYRMRGEIDPHEAAKEYGELLKDKFGDGGLDLIFLGMGDDGHTASLFPGTTAVEETKHRVVANYAEHSTTGRSWRVTMTALFINRARDIMVLVEGAEKARRISEILEGPRDPKRLPIQLIDPRAGKMAWLMDAAAAGM